MDPVGVAARDLRECLLIQARTYHSGDGNLRRFIERHIDNMEKRQYEAIKRDMDLTAMRMVRLAKIVQNMEPKPGRGFSTDETHYITPDVYVQKMGDDYRVSLNEDGLPKLKVSNYYKSAMSGGSGQAKDYIQDKFRSAVWLIRSIHQRQNTIEKLLRALLDSSRTFLIKDRSTSVL